MIHKVQLIDLGDEGAFLPLPDQFLNRMNLGIGDDVVTTAIANGYALTPPRVAHES